MTPALSLDLLPRSLIVLGGGCVASELGQFFSRLDVATTMIVRASHLLSSEDRDIGQTLTSAFINEGITIENGANVSHVERKGKSKGRVFHKKRQKPFGGCA